MRTHVTDADIRTYRDQGFLIVADFLDDEELTGWRDIVGRAVAARRSTGNPYEVTDPSQLSETERRSFEYYSNVFTQRVNLWQSDTGVRDLILDERIGRLAADLAGVDAVRMWHDQALVKQPYANPTGFHLDVPYWSFTSPHAISIWVALDDATMQNGCLYYLPGTHHDEEYDNVNIGNELGALFDVYPDWRAIEPVAAPVPAGGCLWHNGLTAHGAGPNFTPRPRRAMTAGFMPDGSTFNGKPNILRPEQLARLSVGDPLDDDEQNPIVYSRNAQGAGGRARAGTVGVPAVRG